MKVAGFILVVGACGGGRGGPDAPPTTANDGFIWLESHSDHTADNQADTGGNVDANFATGRASCTSLGSAGPCVERLCPVTTIATHSAGMIEISGAAVPVSLTPDMTGGYAGFATGQVLFNGGETVTVAASGAEVPAFMKSATMPGKAMITSPLEPSSASPYLTVTRGSPFAVSWTGGSGKLLVALYGGPSDTTEVSCEFDASAGTGTVPAEALMQLPTGTGGFRMAAITDTSVIAGDWDVRIEGYHDAVWPDDTIVNGPTMVQ